MGFLRSVQASGYLYFLSLEADHHWTLRPAVGLILPFGFAIGPYAHPVNLVICCKTMTQIAERYTQLARAYAQLSDKFQQLDVAHMTLKEKVVPLLKALKAYQQLVEQLKQGKATLEHQLQTLTTEKQTLETSLVSAQTDNQALTARLHTLEAEKQAITLDLQVLQAQYDTLEPLALLLQPESQATLVEAESQMELIEETLQEIASNSDPGLSETDKQLLAAYEIDPQQFLLPAAEPTLPILYAVSPAEAIPA
jgi:chromosome segregation ATPase